MQSAIFPATRRRRCGSPAAPRVPRPRLATVPARCSCASYGPEDLVTSLWLSVFDADGTHREVLLADPRVLLADADDEDVPAEEKVRRERAREGGSGIVRIRWMRLAAVVFTINGQLFLTEIAEDGSGRTRMLAADGIAAGEGATVLNPRISPDGRHVAYTTGEHLMLVDIAPQWPSDSRHDDATDDDCDGQPAPHPPCGDEESGAPLRPLAISSARCGACIRTMTPTRTRGRSVWPNSSPARRWTVTTASGGGRTPSHHLRDVQRGT